MGWMIIFACALALGQVILTDDDDDDFSYRFELCVLAMQRAFEVRCPI